MWGLLVKSTFVHHIVSKKRFRCVSRRVLHSGVVVFVDSREHLTTVRHFFERSFDGIDAKLENLTLRLEQHLDARLSDVNEQLIELNKWVRKNT